MDRTEHQNFFVFEIEGPLPRGVAKVKDIIVFDGRIKSVETRIIFLSFPLQRNPFLFLIIDRINLFKYNSSNVDQENTRGLKERKKKGNEHYELRLINMSEVRFNVKQK